MTYLKKNIKHKLLANSFLFLIFCFSNITQAVVLSSYRTTLVSGTPGQSWGWGYNSDGQLGDGGKDGRAAAVSLVALDDIKLKQVSTGIDHALALTETGQVYSWGKNNDGQLGNDSIISTQTPLPLNDLNNIVAVAAGNAYSLAVKNDGTLWGWGYPGNSNGLPSRNGGYLKPTLINNINNVKTVAASNSGDISDAFSLVLKQDGSVWGMGVNDKGQLGNGTTVSSKAPTQVLALKNISAISVGDCHALALKNDGSVYSWGCNDTGKLGNNSTSNSTAPIKLSLQNIVAISSGAYNSMALDSEGHIWIWGDNSEGQLGDNTKIDQLSPIKVNLDNVVAISSARAYSVAVLADGSVKAWGINSEGQVGNNKKATNATESKPVSVLSNSNLQPLNIGSTISSSITATYNTNTTRLVIPSLAVSVTPVFGGTPAIQNYSIELQQRSGGGFVFDLDINKITQLPSTSSNNCTATYSQSSGRLVIPCLAVSVVSILGGTPVIQNYSVELQQRSGGGFVFDLDLASVK